MTLQERIVRGERAIAQARALGKDVSSWEAHLASLRKAATRRDTRSLQSHQGYGEEVKEGMGDDPILPAEAWYREFHGLHVQIAQENPDFDRLWLKQYRPDLHQAIRAKENEIDALQEARLSQVMIIMREWRELVLKAEFERREAEGKSGPA